MKRYVWIEAEEWPEDSWDCNDCNTDVIVVFPDRSKWIASFFTYLNIETLRQKNIQTGECMNGSYFWSSDMVLIDVISRERIEKLIDHLIEQDNFQSVFNRYPDVDAEDDEHYPVGFFTTEGSLRTGTIAPRRQAAGIIGSLLNNRADYKRDDGFNISSAYIPRSSTNFIISSSMAATNSSLLYMYKKTSFESSSI